jgi:hypothetical protein
MAMPDNALDLGRLLRVQAMVTEVAQTQATHQAGIALVKAYNSLRGEITLIVAGEELASLREECSRLFPHMDYPNVSARMSAGERIANLDTAASEALLNLRKLGGWIQGLINERTLDQRLRLAAEEQAKLEAKPGMGFKAQ